MDEIEENNIHLEHLFRHSYGKAISVLLSRFGPHTLQIVEDAVQDALLKAMKFWSFKEMPERPEAWLIKVAYRNVIDVLRRKQRWDELEESVIYGKDEAEILDEPLLPDHVKDDQLQMIFACCHPNLPMESQVILTLKLVAGFGNKEVAAVLLKKEDAIAKAFTRAKNRWIEKKIKFDVPIEMGLTSRLNVVLKIIYLIFTEGYNPHRGSNVVRRDICHEAIRLALLLDQNKYCSQPSVKALLALMCFHTSRFDARMDAAGNLIDLQHQRRSLWNQDLIQQGIKFLNQAYSATDLPFDYLLQAYVSYYHCIAIQYSDTNWQSILDVYDLQMVHNYSPAIELNRIIPFYKIHGVDRALDLLQNYKRKNPGLLKGLFYAINGDLLKEQGSFEEAVKAYKTALESMNNQVEIEHIKNKIECLNLYH